MVTPVGSLLPPEQRPFGKYELVAKLATGGMAEIFLARQRAPRSPDPLVIKRVLPHLAEDERFVSMFRDEARLASRIDHANVCRVIEAGTVGHTYFIAMEYLHGVPLSRLMFRAARLKEMIDPRLVAAVVQQSCEGLHHAHELKSLDGRSLGVVHRDISPPNIFVTAAGEVRLLDFGVAKARGASQRTRTGTVKGKNSYMSPEQILTKDVDRRSDVFSLGVVMWECLTTRRLFSRDSDFMTFRAITEDEIPSVTTFRGDVDGKLSAVVDKALARDADERYPTALALRNAVVDAMTERGGAFTNEEIATYVSNSYAQELDRMRKLLANMSQEVKAVSGEPDLLDMEVAEVEIEAEDDESFAAAETVAATPAEVAKQRYQQDTGTDELPRGAGPGRKRALIVGAFAAAATAALAVVLMTGDDAKAPKADTASDPGASSDAIQERAGGPEAGEYRPSDATDPATPVDAAVTARRADPVDAGVKVAAIPVDAAAVVDRRPGYLTVDSTPYATIYVDGKELGVTPIFKHKLSPGKHRLKAVSATGDSKRMRVRISPNRTKNLGRLTWDN